jgi:hypothetical protein
VVAQLVVCLPLAQVTGVRFPLKLFFLIAMSQKVFMTKKDICFFSLCSLSHVFIFFFALHILKMGGVHLVSQRAGFSCFASSGLLSSNTDDAWHFEVEGSPSIALMF